MNTESMNGLKEIQSRLLDALISFDNICTNIGCKYSLMCGTLLGAVRHKGFIPWDDDVDIVMFREEFNQFQMYCHTNELPGGLCLDEKDTWVPRIKIRKSKEIFLDIFILDKIAPNNNLQKYTLLKLKILQGMMKKNIVYSRYKKSDRLKILVTHVMGKPFSFEWKYKQYHKLAAKYNSTNINKYYISNGAFGVTSIVWDEDEFSKFVRVPFHEKTFMITDQYRSVLTKLYGSTYMQLPPESERIPKHNS